MIRHYLKIWPEFFDAVESGRKTFELRKNDRQFVVNDQLVLREWDPATEDYTGRETLRTVTYLLGHRPDAGCAATFGLHPDYVILGVASALTSQPRGSQE